MGMVSVRTVYFFPGSSSSSSLTAAGRLASHPGVQVSPDSFALEHLAIRMPSGQPRPAAQAFAAVVAGPDGQACAWHGRLGNRLTLSYSEKKASGFNPFRRST
jgi:hypothetical protein